MDEFYAANPDVSLVRFDGPAKGFAANYMSLLRKAGSEYKYYAFCDQDDIWDSDKLCRALKAIEDVRDCADSPILYGSRTQIVDQNGVSLGFSPLFKKRPSFENALVQNISGGNTMVFDCNLRALMLKVENVQCVVSHDWLAYLIATAVAGTVIYDTNSCLKYRQHNLNRVGSNRGWPSRVKRLWQVFVKRRFREWHSMNVECLRFIEDDITAENKMVLRKFETLKEKWLIMGTFQLLRSGLYRQTLMETLTLYAAAFLKRI